MPDEVTLGELGRRIDQLAHTVQTNHEATNARLDKVPTQDLLAAYMATLETRVKNVEDDVSEIKTRAQQARSIAITSAIGVAGLVVAAISVVQQGGVGG